MTVLSLAAVMTALSLGMNAAAQPGPGLGGWGPGMMMGPGMMGPGMMGPECVIRGRLAEWRIAAIEHAVRPTDAQRPALDELKAASTKAAEMIAAACPNDFPTTTVGRLEVMEKRLEEMLQA